VVTKRELAAEIAALHRALPDQPVVIAADRKVRYEEVMHAMNVLQKAQISRIGLLARPAP
jgi:biopolymer transport protein TolR